MRDYAAKGALAGSPRGRLSVVGFALGVLTALVGVAAGGGSFGMTATCLPSGATGPYTLTASSAGLKPVNAGLLMRGPAMRPPSLAGVVHGFILEEHWNQAQPTGPSDFVTSNIDAAVAKVRHWNAANPTDPQALRLRIEAGINAPNWVKAMDGGPVPVTSSAGQTGTVPRWWDSDVQAAYASFVAKLAAYTDDIPEIREVTVGLTMEFFGEVFIRFPQQNAAALEAAGYTQAADIAAMEAQFRAHLAFQHTTTQIDVNAYQQLSGGGSLTVTQQLMNYALSIGLAHVQFANASLDDSGNDPLYALMQAYGPSGSGEATLTFQSMPNPSNSTTVVQRAISYGAGSLELPYNPPSASVLAPLDQTLRAQVGVTPLGGQIQLPPDTISSLVGSSGAGSAVAGAPIGRGGNTESFSHQIRADASSSSSATRGARGLRQTAAGRPPTSGFSPAGAGC